MQKLWIWRADYTLKYALSQLLLSRKPGLRQEYFGMAKKFVYFGHPNNFYLFKPRLWGRTESDTTEAT